MMNILTPGRSFCFLIAALATSIFVSANVFAQDQDYLQLNAFSPFYCRYLANGKTEIAQKTPAGKYKKLSFDKAREASGKRKAQLRNSQKKLSAIKTKLEKQKTEITFGPGQLNEREKKLILNFANGLDPNERFPLEDINQTIARLGEFIKNLQINLEFLNLERNQIKNCERRLLPPLNSIPITYEVLIAENKSSTTFRWYAAGVVFMSQPAVLFQRASGSTANAVCLTFKSGLKRLVSFVSDPVGENDSLYSYASNHPIVLAGETARLLPRNSKNEVTFLGYVPDLFSKTSGSMTREGAENSVKSVLPKKMEEWGNSADAKWAKFDKKQNKYICPE